MKNCSERVRSRRGQEKASVKDVFYSPVTRKFDLRSALSYLRWQVAFLGENFLDKIEIDVSGMEDYVRANQQRFGLKAEERVIKAEYEEPPETEYSQRRRNNNQSFRFRRQVFL